CGRHAAASGGALGLWDGDIAQPSLGLSPEVLARWPAFDHVIHLAALYDLRAPADRLRAINVDGTRELIALLRQRSFTGILHHTSSIAVAGDHKGTFTEAELDVRQKH